MSIVECPTTPIAIIFYYTHIKYSLSYFIFPSLGRKSFYRKASYLPRERERVAKKNIGWKRKRHSLSYVCMQCIRRLYLLYMCLSSLFSGFSFDTYRTECMIDKNVYMNSGTTSHIRTCYIHTKE